MTNNMLLATVAPEAVERLRRLEFALLLVRNGMNRREAQRIIRERFGVSRWTAWRIMAIAVEMSC